MSEEERRVVKKKAALKAPMSRDFTIRRAVITDILGDSGDVPVMPEPGEAIAELNNAVKRWSRITGTYNLLCDLKTGIPANERVFPVLEIPMGDEDTRKLVIDPSTWTQADQLALIDLMLGNIVNEYHKQLGGLADAAVTSVASFVAAEGSGE